MSCSSEFMKDVHPEWLTAIEDVIPKIEEIEISLQGTSFNPAPENVFRALRNPLHKTRVVIFGQDPYPNREHAMGLAFSVNANVTPLPMSLQNIFLELASDIGCTAPTRGDLSGWADQGVALINRVLTVPNGSSNGHIGIGWQKVTDEIARILGEREVVAILWGNNARQLAHFFRDEWIVASVHPSPLSAHRGFFGSKPFTKANAILRDHGLDLINWETL